jgi:hypothetical protein
MVVAVIAGAILGLMIPQLNPFILAGLTLADGSSQKFSDGTS